MIRVIARILTDGERFKAQYKRGPFWNEHCEPGLAEAFGIARQFHTYEEAYQFLQDTYGQSFILKRSWRYA